MKQQLKIATILSCLLITSCGGKEKKPETALPPGAAESTSTESKNPDATLGQTAQGKAEFKESTQNLDKLTDAILHEAQRAAETANKDQAPLAKKKDEATPEQKAEAKMQMKTEAKMTHEEAQAKVEELTLNDAPKALPEKKAAASPIYGRDKYYFVQVASYTKKTDAIKLAETLKGGAVAPLVDVADLNGTTYHRVMLGAFANRTQAEEFILSEKLKDKFTDVFVRKAFKTELNLFKVQ